MNAYLPHEKLKVYDAALESMRSILPIMSSWPMPHSVRDQGTRAGESVLINLARSAQRRRTDQGIYYIECSLGSVLEIAACLDIAFAKGLIKETEVKSHKKALKSVARMEVGLRDAWRQEIHDAREPYTAKTDDCFSHESLEVYKSSLQLCRWIEGNIFKSGMRKSHQSKRIDEASTSLVLNIAEGNGRFSRLDHGKFIKTAEDSAAVLGVFLDLVAPVSSDVDVEPAKEMLREIAAMLAGLRGYLLDDR